MDGAVDWSNEWINSLIWIIGVTVAAALGSGLVGVLLVRTTTWGRQFWRLAGPFFRPTRERGSWVPLLFVTAILLITITTVRMNVLFSYQGNGLFTALQNLDADGFWFFVVLFLVLAAIWVVKELLRVYVQQVLAIRWRVSTNDRMVGDWLRGGAYHRGQFVKDRVDNPDQRIQEDVSSFVSLSLGLAFGAIGALVSLVSFTLILWTLSGPLNIFGLEIPRAMTFFAFLYVIIASVIAFRIGRPLILLNFLNEKLTGSFRYALVRMRENSERVAFYRGEQVERATLDSPVRRRHRQLLGDPLPEPEVPGVQLRGHPGRRAGAASDPGPTVPGRDASPSATSPRPPPPSARCTTRCRSSATPTTTSPATAPCSTGSPGCSTPTTRPAICRRSISARAPASRSAT